MSIKPTRKDLQRLWQAWDAAAVYRETTCLLRAVSGWKGTRQEVDHAAADDLVAQKALEDTKTAFYLACKLAFGDEA